jgi:hypothetical protein
MMIQEGMSCATVAFNKLESASASLRSAVVEPVGIEPTTPCLQSRCSPS